VQVKVTKYKQNGKIRNKIKLFDISASVLYDQQIAHNKLLQMINACISHELRNPLNSIFAQNLEKEHLYSEILSMFERGNIIIVD